MFYLCYLLLLGPLIVHANSVENRENAEVTFTSAFSSVIGFSSNYDTVLINEQAEGINLAQGFTSLKHSRSPLMLLLWPFNLTIIQRLCMDTSTNRRLLIVLSLSEIPILRTILDSFAEHYNGSKVIRPVFLIQLRNDSYSDIQAAANFVPRNLVELSCDIYFLNSFDNVSEIAELYSIKNITQLQFVPVRDQDLMTTILIKATRRQNFFQVPIVGVVQKLDTAGNNGGIRVDRTGVGNRVKFVSGFRMTEYQYFSDALNFTQTDGIEGKGFPRLPEPGSSMLTGMGTQLELDEADLVTQSIEFAPFRVEKLTYLHPTSEESLCAYFKQLPVSSMRNIYFDAFPMDLWFVYLAVWIVLTASAILIDVTIARARASTSHFLGQESDESTSLISDHILQAVGTFCQQGWYDERTNSGGIKILKLTELLASLILYSAYCASLVSLFSVPVVPIGSFKDILSYSFKLYPDNYSLAAKSFVQDLESSNATLPPNPFFGPKFISVNESIGVILASKSAYIIPDYMFLPELLELNYSVRFLCENIVKVTNFRESVKSAMILKKGTPYKEAFNLKILQMFERGIRSRLRGLIRRDQSLTCLTENEMNPVQDRLEIIDVSTAFVVIIFGFILSFALLVSERMVLACK